MIKKIISCVMALVLSLGIVGCSGCNSKKNSTTNENTTGTVEKLSFEGTHVFNVTETSEYLVENGQTSYVALVNYENDALGLNAIMRSEFSTFFKMATGININFLSDAGYEWNEDAKIISIGDTEALEQAGLALNPTEWSNDGARIQTIGNSIFLYGGDLTGCLYAVYDFLQYEFNFEYYYTDCYDIDTGIKNVTLKNYDITDIPDIEKRSPSYGWLYSVYSGTTDDEKYDRYRARMPYTNQDYLLPIYTKWIEDNNNSVSGLTYASIHNVLEFVPLADYYYNENFREESFYYMNENHPKWYSADLKQVCFTAHGDEAELAKMIDVFAQKIIQSLTVNTPTKAPLKNTVTITIEDGAFHCTCEACLAQSEQYGGSASKESAIAIRFINRVAEVVDAWMELPENAEYKRDLTYLFFAYNFYIDPPVVVNAEGKYEAFSYINENGEKEYTRCSDNVGVYFCPAGDRTCSIYNEKNDETREQFAQWQAVSDSIWAWSYSTNFKAYNYFSDTFARFTSEYWQLNAASNVSFAYNNSQAYCTQSGTAFHTLKSYLDSKLMWNCNLEENVLIEKYFNAMYKDAADVMYRYFTEMRLHCTTSIAASDRCGIGVVQTSYWPYNFLKGCMDYCDVAIQKVEKYKTTDPTLYEKIVNHIEVEWFSPAYIIWTLGGYKQNLSAEELATFKPRFKNAIELIDGRQSENGSENSTLVIDFA